MRSALVDTGPLVAYLNSRDKHHEWAVEMMAETRPPLLTCEAVLSEATFLTNELSGGPKILSLVQKGLVQPAFRLQDQADEIATLLRRYGSVPMDLADACLVRMAEQYPDAVLLTIDSEFRDIYRRSGRKVIQCLLPSGIRARKRRSRRSS